MSNLATEVLCPDLRKYVIELADGTIFRPIAPNATDAMAQADRAYKGVAITGIREVQR